MKLYSNILLVAVLKALWLQKVSAELSNFPFISDNIINDTFSSIFDGIRRSDNTLNTDLKKTLLSNSYGSHVVQTGHFYSKNDRRNIYGIYDVQDGKVYSGNPGGANTFYGAIVVQKNNNYTLTGKNIQLGASLKQFGNSYPKNPGKNYIYAPVVIQEDNNYFKNPGKNNVEQIHNTNSKSVEDKYALKPVIYQRRNVNLPTPGINGVVGSVVKNNGNRFQIKMIVLCLVIICQ